MDYFFPETQQYEERVPDEQRLFQEIMEGYEIAVRPSTNTSGVITVKFGLRLNQIIDLVGVSIEQLHV